MKPTAPRKLWKRAQTPPPLTGRPVLQKPASTGKLKAVMGRCVRQEFLGRGGILMEKYHQAGKDHSRCQATVYSDRELARAGYQSHHAGCHEGQGVIPLVFQGWSRHQILYI